jgi:hypothetical protein
MITKPTILILGAGASKGGSFSNFYPPSTILNGYTLHSGLGAFSIFSFRLAPST